MKDDLSVYDKLREWFIKPMTQYRSHDETGKQAIERLWDTEAREITTLLFFKETAVDHKRLECIDTYMKPKHTKPVVFTKGSVIVFREESDGSIHFDRRDRHYRMPAYLLDDMKWASVVVPRAVTKRSLDKALKAKGLSEELCLELINSLPWTSKQRD